MFFSNPREARRVLWQTFRLRCPHCGIGRTFTGLFKAEPVCTHCGVRFERESGESVGGMYINLGVAEVTTLGGFFLVNALFQPPVLPHLIVWVVYNIAFVTLMYSRSRSLWIGISYLTGGVYRDDDPRARDSDAA
ncbi:MAG: DUF983 domain-containing protein [bacterium]|nr:DUF983 domain-containing protein [bacterium]